jgi:CDP-diacylglycerol--serine O-phosphatidyltransferase
MRKEQQPRLRRKGIYLLPNLLTTLALFFGFYALVAATRGDFDHSAISIFIAMIFDGLDGRVARMTNTASAFGAEYDSLSDLVTFGIAPSVLAYNWGLDTLGNIGWLVAFMYTAATALRLARFNTQIAHASKRYFQGLPCPAAAAVVASLIWILTTNTFSIESTHALYVSVAVVVAVLAILMISQAPFYSFKEVKMRNRVPFVMMLLVIIICVAIALDPSVVLFIAFFGYALSGIIVWCFQRRKKSVSTRLIKKHGK